MTVPERRLSRIPSLTRRSSVQSPKPLIQRRSSTKFIAWSNPEFLTFGGFDRFERQGQNVDGAAPRSRGIFRKASVLDERMEKIRAQVQIHEAYEDPKDINCRESSFNVKKSVAKSNFVTRHNPVSVNELRQTETKRFGSLYRTKSSDLNMHYETPTLQLLSFDKLRSKERSSMMWEKKDLSTAAKQKLRSPIKKQALGDDTGTWVLSNLGRHEAFGISKSPTKSKMLASQKKSLRPWTTPTSMLSSLQGRSKVYSTIGKHVDFSNEAQVASLTRTFSSTNPHRHRKGFDASQFFSGENPREIVSRIEIAPREISLDHLRLNERYLYPIRIRNVGSHSDRFRVSRVNISTGCIPVMARIIMNREKSFLAPGLSLEILLEVYVKSPGILDGVVQIETRAGTTDINIFGCTEQSGRPVTK